jgi:hypothetical protein
MGVLFTDQYSLLHFATGIIAFFWGFSILFSFVMHCIFEFIENTPQGMKFINKNLDGIWPGGKPHADTLINIYGDTIFFLVGWISAYMLNMYGTKYKWYY